jgi:hypothetical protein
MEHVHIEVVSVSQSEAPSAQTHAVKKKKNNKKKISATLAATNVPPEEEVYTEQCEDRCYSDMDAMFPAAGYQHYAESAPACPCPGNMMYPLMAFSHGYSMYPPGYMPVYYHPQQQRQLQQQQQQQQHYNDRAFQQFTRGDGSDDDCGTRIK